MAKWCVIKVVDGGKTEKVATGLADKGDATMIAESRRKKGEKGAHYFVQEQAEIGRKPKAEGK